MSRTSTPSPRPYTPISGRIWRLAVVLALGGVMAGLDGSIVNVGLATIRDDLDASLTAIQWVSSGYLLALAAALPVCGWLSRRVGAGRLWLWSLAGFTLASGLCAAAWNVELLIVFRVLQGMAGGLLVPTGMTVLAQAAGASQLGRLMATSSVPAILAPGVGPVLGAVLLAQLSWHWMFLINVPIGLASLAVGVRTVPVRSAGEDEAGQPLDVPALLLVVPGLPLLVYGITHAAETRSLLTAAVAGPLALGLALLAAFTRRCLTSPHPLVDLRLFGDRVYRAASVEVLFNGAALFGGLIVMPLYFQLLLARDIIDTGLLLIAFSVGAAVTFPVAGRLTDRFGGPPVAVAGLLVTAASTLPFAVLPADPDLVLVEALQVIRGIGLALSGMPVVTTALAAVRRHQIPDATTQVNALSRVGGALGSALFIVVLTGQLPTDATGPATLDGFRNTFSWLAAATLGALVGAVWLLHETRRAGTHTTPPPRTPTRTKTETTS
ncbi:MDR family MFS transporter [Geodermatophilus sp. DSM 44513]|uniref:MDR family MFS transporter n=1 Tax=Geodermatophilus sp. DSM 44513 TaxID=1528104 RepID=UPI00127A7A22|nr:MDR family MFS transporter [Geodermatophilus sp. DSM 44513]WNV74303.1 MDR family MFS transporter [Geodermatophilus sp. DSM 44513]